MNNQQKVNILGVDDNSTNLMVLEGMLSRLNHRLVKAHSGEEALQAVAEMDFAVILLDVQMPVMDGFETAEFIRKNPRSSSTPIIFITANSQTEKFIFKGYSVGAVDYLLKPIKPDILTSKVSVFIDLFIKNEEIKAQALMLESMNHELELKLAEISQLNQQYQNANNQLKIFNSSVSHDLRNPLTSILTMSELLWMRGAPQLGEKEKQYLQRIRASAKRMGELIEDLRNLSLGAEREMNYEKFNLSTIVEKFCLLLKERDPDRSTQFIITPEVILNADAGLIKIVVENLLNNAWKYSQKKPETIIEFGTMNDGEKQIYFIRDNGAGFDMKKAEKLFTPFERLHTNNEFEGTGIGLATVYNIIQRHHGSIWAESTLGEGSTFWFYLPETPPANNPATENKFFVLS
jgi:two-component system, sensor histidine kinase and response regulator